MFLDRQGPYRARHLVWPGARNQSGAATDTHFAWPRCRGTYCGKVVLPWRPLAYTPRITRCRGAGGGISCAEGDSGPPRDGREPSWTRPCEASGALLLSNGGSGGGHETCTLWPPPAPFGYFPVMESTSSARRRTKPLTRNRFLVEGKEKGLPSFSCITENFASAEATRGLSDRPLDPFGALLRQWEGARKKQISCGRQGKDLPYFFLFYGGFRLCGGDQRAFRSPFGNLRPFQQPSSLQKMTASYKKNDYII